MKKLIVFLVLGFFVFPLVFAGGTKLKAKIEAVDAATGTVVLKGKRYQIDNLTFWSQGLVSEIFGIIKVGDVLEVKIDNPKANGLRRLISLELEHFEQGQCSACSSQQQSNTNNNHANEHHNSSHSSNNHNYDNYSTERYNHSSANNHHSSHNDDHDNNTHHSNNSHNNHDSDHHDHNSHSSNHHGSGHHD